MVTEQSKLEKKNEKDFTEEDCTSMTEALQQIVGSDRSELNETVKSSTAKAVQDASNRVDKEAPRDDESR